MKYNNSKIKCITVLRECDNMIDTVNIVIGIISLLIGMIGAILTYKSYLKERALKNVSWDDINAGTKFLWKKLYKHGFIPDLFISPDPKGGIIAHLLSQFYDCNIFTDVGYAIYKNSTLADSFSEENYTIINTNRWKVFLSKAIQDMPNKENKKVIIVDDFVLSGDFNAQLSERLISYGYSKENIIICCIAVTKVAIRSEKAPNFYWKIVDDEDFYFPWGKAE